jgi:hypothetical protein
MTPDWQNRKPNEPMTFGETIVAFLRGVLSVFRLPFEFLHDLARIFGIALWITVAVVGVAASIFIAVGSTCRFWRH